MRPVSSLTRPRFATRYARLSLPLLLLPTLAFPQSDADPAGLGYESATESHRGFDAGPLPSEADTDDAVDGEASAIEPDTGAALPDSGTGAKPAGDMPTPVDPDAGERAARRGAPEPDTDAALPDSGTEAKPAGDMPVPVDPDAAEKAAQRGEPAVADEPSQGNAALRHDSVLEDYEPYEESDGPSWVEANDAVGRIGGWRTYARELYESDDGEFDGGEGDTE